MHEHSHDGRTKSNWDNTQKWPQEVNPLTSFNPLTKQLQQVNQSCVCWCSLFGASWLAWQRPTPRVYVWINLCCQCSDSSMSHSCYIKLLLFDRLTADRCAIPRNIRLLSDSAHHTQQVWDDSFYCPFFWSLLYFRDFVITEVKICYGFHFHSSIFKKNKMNKNIYLYGDAWPFPLLTRWVCRWRWGCTPAAEKGSETPRPAPHQ